MTELTIVLKVAIEQGADAGQPQARAEVVRFESDENASEKSAVVLLRIG